MGSEPARRAPGAVPPPATPAPARTPSPPSILTRRRLLTVSGALGLGGLLAGCTGGSGPATPTTSAVPPAVDPLLALLTDREALLARCDATGALHPDLVGRLQPVQAQTTEQVVVLRLALALPTATPSASAPASGSSESGSSASGSAGSTGSAGAGSATSGPPPPAVPPDPGAALAEVRAAVRAAGVAAESLCLIVTAERAPLVGSLAAAAAGHDLVLS